MDEDGLSINPSLGYTYKVGVSDLDLQTYCQNAEQECLRLYAITRLIWKSLQSLESCLGVHV